MKSPQNQRMKLTGAAILVSRGMKVLQGSPAGSLSLSFGEGGRTGGASNLGELQG
jgi:hypothetical protein